MPGRVYLLCSIIFLQPLISNVIAILSAKFLFFQVDLVALSPLVARIIVVMYLYHMRSWRFLGLEQFPLLIFSVTLSYVLFCLLSFWYAFTSVDREYQDSHDFIPHSYIIKRGEVLNYLISTISSLAPYGLLLPLTLHFSLTAGLDFSPSLALAITFVTFSISISQQYWMRLKMGSVYKLLEELGRPFLKSTYFRRSIILVVLFQAFLIVFFYFFVPFILSFLIN